MKRLLAFLLVLSVAVLTAMWARQDPGFVVIGRGVWSLETSLSVFVFLLLGVFFLLYFLVQLAGGLWQLPERFQAAYRAHRRQKSRLALLNGFSALAEGQWPRAEQELTKTDPEFLHYLGAAYAAQQRGALEQRDTYLNQAQQQVPGEYALAAGLFQAELYLRQAQFTLAQALLKQLQERFPKHPRILELLGELHRRAEKWQALLELLPELRKRKLVSAEQADDLELRALSGLLREAAEHGPESLDALWNRLPKAMRLAPRLLEVYAGHLLAQGRAAQAEPLLKEALRQHWDTRLVALYGSLELDAAKQLNQAESWLKGHDNDPVLLLVLGRLCMRNRLWGKAQQYLDHSLHKQPSAETYLALGELLGQIGDANQAAEYYKKGLQFVTAACARQAGQA